MKRKPQTTVEATGILRARFLDCAAAFRRLFSLKDFLIVAAIVFIFGGFAEYASAQIYKCKDDNGNLIYSQQSCGADAKEVVITNTTAGISMAGEGDFSRVDAANREREIDRAIDRRYRAISNLQETRDSKLADLRRQQGLANNNLAGATYLQGIATEMQAVTDDYNARISMERSAIQDLNAQR